MRNLKSALLEALVIEGINKQTFAFQRDIKPAEVSRFLSEDGQLTTAMKLCILKNWSSPQISEDLFDAHIKDEAEIMGLSSQPETK